MKKKQCSYCGQTYKPKSNNSKYCSKECKAKRDNEIRNIRYKTDPEYRKQILEEKAKRFKERYWNEEGYKEKRHQYQKNYRATPKGKKKNRELSLKCYYQNHEESKRLQAERHKEKYQNDEEYRKKIIKRNQEWRKTHEGKMSYKRKKAKRRKLGFILLFNNPFPKEIQVEFHHINRIFVIPLPRKTHQYISGHNKQKHLKFNKKWIEKIYNIKLEEIIKK